VKYYGTGSSDTPNRSALGRSATTRARNGSILSLLVIATLLAGCALAAPGRGAQPPAAGIVDSSLQCSHPERQPAVRRITTQQQLQQVAAQMHGTRLAPKAPPSPSIDFNRWNILFISAGERPTAGYRLQLAEPAFTVSRRRAHLWIALKKPASDARVAAVVTMPCLLVRVPVGDYSTIEVHGLERRYQIAVEKGVPLQGK